MAPGVRREPVSNLDVAPTLLELLGLRVHGEIQGISLAGALRGEPADGGRILHAELDRLYASIRGPRKLIWNASRGGIELYDLDADPAEAADISRAGGIDRAELSTAAARFARENTREVPVADDEENLKVLRSLGYVD